MAKVLITGGAGFVGSHLCDRLVAQGDEVIVYDDFSSGSRRNIAHLSGKVKVVEGSVLDIHRQADEFAGVSRVYHLAALISGHDSLLNPQAYLEVNLNGLARLIELVARLGVERVVFASSSTVYGEGPARARAEGDRAGPLTTYALTKYAGEHMLALYARLHGFDYVCLRLFNVYGPRQNPDHPYANVTCKFSAAAAGNGRVRRYGDGEQSRDFVYVDDAVEAFARLSGGGREPIYNVGSGLDTSINRLIREVERAGGRPLTVEPMPDWPNDVRAIRADVSRLEGEFGFRPATPLAAGLERTIAYFRHRPELAGGP